MALSGSAEFSTEFSAPFSELSSVASSDTPSGRSAFSGGFSSSCAELSPSLSEFSVASEAGDEPSWGFAPPLSSAEPFSIAGTFSALAFSSTGFSVSSTGFNASPETPSKSLTGSLPLFFAELFSIAGTFSLLTASTPSSPSSLEAISSFLLASRDAESIPPVFLTFSTPPLDIAPEPSPLMALMAEPPCFDKPLLPRSTAPCIAPAALDATPETPQSLDKSPPPTSFLANSAILSINCI